MFVVNREGVLKTQKQMQVRGGEVGLKGIDLIRVGIVSFSCVMSLYTLIR